MDTCFSENELRLVCVCVCVCVCGPDIIVIAFGAAVCTEGPTRSLHKLLLASLLAAVLAPLH